MKILNKIFGDPAEKFLKKAKITVDQINNLEKKFEDFSDEQLKAQTNEFKKLLEQGKTLEDILPEAFAVVREAAKRSLGQRHYDVQLIGGLALHYGNVAEQKTGEGKTLTSTLAIYLNALTGKGIHSVTVNDYLSRRDCGWMGPIFNFLGLSVGVIIHQAAFLYDENFIDENASDPKLKHLRPVGRKEAYAADITYGTNNEFGFDYLRDNMAQDKNQMVQRELNYAIVDEVDSILIDEARTPLIISAPDTEPTDKYYQFAKIVEQLKENEDYNIDEKMRAATLTEAGINKVEKKLGVENIYTEGGVREVHHIEQALKALTLFKRDKDYVVKDNEVLIVDEFTGRLMEGRRYSQGLHQAIEAKENVAIQRESRTLATITFQNYFRLYKKLAGMTGTAQTEKEEFYQIYGLDVIVIPTNKPIARQDLPDRIYKDEAAKLQAIAKEVKQRSAKGQPVLIGTISIEKNEMIAEALSQQGIEFQMLNAKFHLKEAQIIAQAGRPGAVTVATNMAGRGVDIKLGGDPVNKEDEAKVIQAGGLFVLGTERHESRRIDNQLRGRSGRQGDPGASQFYVSTDDDLMRIFGSDRIKSIMQTLKIPDDMPIENKIITRSLESAQKKVEGYHFDTRKHLVQYDDVLNRQRETIYKRRREILFEDNSKDQILQTIKEEITTVVKFHTHDANEQLWNMEEIYEVVNTIFPVDGKLRLKLNDITTDAGSDTEDNSARGRLIGYLFKLAVQRYNQFETEVEKQVGSLETLRQTEKAIMLRSIDMLWIEYLETLDHLRAGIGLRGYGQREPIIEYKNEAYVLFNTLLSEIRKEVVYSIFKLGVNVNIAPQAQNIPGLTLQGAAKTMQAGMSGIPISLRQKTPQAKQVEDRQAQVIENSQTHYNGQRVGRNDLCPCGSGKKFKKCHGA